MFDLKKYNREYMKQWRKDNPEKSKATSKRYYDNHREELVERARKWLKNHPEKLKEIYKQYHENHPAIYRKIMEEKLGRKLKEGEQVHHIDMDDTNNNPENLYVYDNGSGHTKGHKSLERLVINLLQKNIIEFKDGIYKSLI